MKNLIFFHGWGAAESIWQRQAQFFGRRLTVLTPTIPTWEVSWCYHYLQTLPLADSLLVGWSLGGMLLLETLGLLEEAPGGLVLVGAAAVFCRRPDHPWGPLPAAVRAMRRSLKEDPQGMLARFATSCLAPEEASFRQEAAAHFETPAHPENLGPGLDHLLRLDLRGRLPRLAAGVTLIQGAGDRIVPPAQARFLQAQLPGSRLHLLPGAGHLPFLTQAETFNRMLQEIIEHRGAGDGRLSTLPPEF
jgi:pimeloyl-[acyl-carrier protein] methyl ester esterase